MCQYDESIGLRGGRSTSVSAAGIHVPKPTLAHSGPQFPPPWRAWPTRALLALLAWLRGSVPGLLIAWATRLCPAPRLDSSHGILRGSRGFQLSASGQHLRQERWKPQLTSGSASRWDVREWGAPFWRKVGTIRGGNKGRLQVIFSDSSILVEDLGDCGFWDLPTIFRAKITKIV